MSFSDILARLDRRFVFLAIMLVVQVVAISTKRRTICGMEGNR